MHSLNPFLRTFFKSSLPAQCNLPSDHILLVPTTESLLNGRDRESDTRYTDLAISEDFLASHVLRINGHLEGDGANVRESRAKAKQFNTINGRTVVIKESFVYSNKGFRNLNQAQLLSDQVFYSDSLDVQQWLIYYISRPLSGVYESVKTIPATLPGASTARDEKNREASNGPSKGEVDNAPSSSSSASTEKRVVKGFNDILGQFPLIARQMQNGLEGVFRDARKDMQDRLKPPKSRRSSQDSSATSPSSRSNGSLHRKLSNGHTRETDLRGAHLGEEVDFMRQRLETAVGAAIDLFQQIDKQQLALLGSTTNLTGPAVELLIERYVTEQLHEAILFPFICEQKKADDIELESRVASMQSIDLAQVGISIDGGRKEKARLLGRIDKGIEEFQKLGASSSPQQMTEILLTTQKLVTASGVPPTTGDKADLGHDAQEREKQSSPLTTNADTLVSLLLMVVIRSQVRHLNARLCYMRNFVFIEDVEAGEIGYALSTFEAVLSYLAIDSGGLRKASKKNKKLWQAIKSGILDDVRSIIDASDPQAVSKDIEDAVEDLTLDQMDQGAKAFRTESSELNYSIPSHTPSDSGYTSEGSTLGHVFPFQIQPDLRKKKRVSMDTRSLSNASEYSFASRTTTTLDSRLSAIEGDISVTTLSQTQDSEGQSLLMMAVEAKQVETLDYLLAREDLFPPHFIFEDANKDNTNLLSAAVQLANPDTVELLLHRLFDFKDSKHIIEYFEQVDNRGRTVAHYLFNTPQLLPRFWNILPWKKRDKNGQTPLFALCRSYDHPDYSDMVNQALRFATQRQNDGRPLCLDDHVDSKGNTLLHVVNDSYIAARILQHCDANANATNEKSFTPLMMASKYGRMDMVRALFMDQRVDNMAREQRGMTAVELAKDDDIRNRIDDMVLISNAPGSDGRVTAVVRSFFVDDASLRMIIKSAIHNDNGTIGVSTCRRSVADFENLARWLALEHPASWLPSIFNFRSPFQIPSRPSRAILLDVQNRLDRFLKVMLAHSTFSNHELLWEFILFPEIQPEMMAERSKKKAELRVENIREEYEPLTDVREVSSFVEHARESIRAVSHCTKSVSRRVASFRLGLSNVAVATELCADSISTLKFLPDHHKRALKRYASCLQPYASEPHETFHLDFQTLVATTLAILSSLARPHALISSLVSTQKAIDRHDASSRRSDRWPLGLLDETRKNMQAEALEKANRGRQELLTLGSELRYTQQTVAGELAEWQNLHAKLGRRAIRAFAEKMVVREKDRLGNMQRAVRAVVDSSDRGRPRRRS